MRPPMEKPPSGLFQSPTTMNATSSSRVAQFANGDPALLEPAILAFLNTKPMVLWAKKELGLEFIRREW